MHFILFKWQKSQALVVLCRLSSMPFSSGEGIRPPRLKIEAPLGLSWTEMGVASNIEQIDLNARDASNSEECSV